MRRVLLEVLLLALVVAPGATGQQLLWQRTGIVDQARLIGMMATLGDLDADGYPEIIAVVDSRPPNFHEYVLWVLSGRDGSTLRVVPGNGLNTSQWQYLTIAEAGDVNADGWQDYLIRIFDSRTSTPFSESIVVEVRSGIDDRVLWRTFGWSCYGFAASVLGGLNLDGDEFDDLVLTVPDDPPNIGHIRAYSGAGELLYRIEGSLSRAFFYNNDGTLGAVGDHDGDGFDDFGAGGGDRTTGTGTVYVFSGRTGDELVRGVDPQFAAAIGKSVIGCGDVDRDGVPDFAAGNDSTLRGMAVLFSGATGEPIHIWRSAQFNGGFDGRFLRSGGQDFDRDGVPDVLAGVGRMNAAIAFSGRDGAVISIARANSPYLTRFGQSVAVLPPFPGSPYPVYAVSEPNFGIPAPILLPGRILMYRSAPPGIDTFGEACTGSLGRAPISGVRVQGNTTEVTVHDAPPATPVALMIGTSSQTFGGHSLPLHLGAFGLTGCSLLTSIEAIVPAVTGVDGNLAGFASIALPGVPAQQGLELNAQWFAFPHAGGPGGALSDAVTWLLQ